MTTRWWAPGGASTAVMLTPGTDANADIGLALMAAHRSGAEALQAVAKYEIPSETGIIAALAANRAKIAPAMVDAIAAHLPPTYAAVLVRDVFDEADQGAVDVYRAMVAKGVSPPVAMDRMAEAYGMPMRQMGAFPAQATDPKANPRSVADAADRALMSYVSKMADAEAPAVAEVSKAALSTAERTEFDRLHPRDAGGQFTETPDTATLSPIDQIRQRLGLLQPAPERVAEEVKPKRKRPKAAVLTPTGQMATLATTAQVATVAGSKPATRTRTRHAQRKTITAAHHRALESRMPTVVPTLKGGTKTVLPDLLHRVNDPNRGADYTRLDKEVVLGVDFEVSDALRDLASTQAVQQLDTTRRIFRIGHLREKANYVDTPGDAAEYAHNHNAQQALYEYDVHEPDVTEVMASELEGDLEKDSSYLYGKRKARAKKILRGRDGSPREYVDPDMLERIKVMKAYSPIGKVDELDEENRPTTDPVSWAIVEYHDVDDNGAPIIPAIDEFVIRKGEAIGYDDGVGESVEVVLDPNQIYEITSAPDDPEGSREGPVRLFDTENKIIVNRWYLRAISDKEVPDIIEGVEKALDVMESRVFEQLHPRDEQGMFTSVAERPTLVSPAARPRKRRRPRQAPAVAGTAQMATLASTAQLASTARADAPARQRRMVRRTTTAARTTTTTHPITAALNARAVSRNKATPELPMLSDARAYKVMDESTFQRMTKYLPKHLFDELHTQGATIDLPSDVASIFAVQGESKVESIPGTMSLNLGADITRQQINRELLDEIPYHSRGGVPDFEHIAERIHSVLERFPDYDLIEVEKNDLDSAVMIMGAQISGGYQNIVEFEHDIDLTGPLTLTYMGEFRARDITAQVEEAEISLIGDLSNMTIYDDEPEKTSVANPLVHYYQVSSPKVRRYRAGNH